MYDSHVAVKTTLANHRLKFIVLPWTKKFTAILETQTELFVDSHRLLNALHPLLVDEDDRNGCATNGQATSRAAPRKWKKPRMVSLAPKLPSYRQVIAHSLSYEHEDAYRSRPVRSVIKLAHSRLGKQSSRVGARRDARRGTLITWRSPRSIQENRSVVPSRRERESIARCSEATRG